MKRDRSLQVAMAIYVFIIMVSASFLTVLFILILYLLKLLPEEPYMPLVLSIVAVIVSIILGTFISALLSRWVLRPIEEMKRATNTIATGDFSVRVQEVKKNNPLAQLIKSFNKMTEDLGGIELFRQDFINNFSHEFKTPIVSIRGFARQLQRSDLTEQQRKEYTDIIMNEAERLTNMSSNVLLLSKFENQKIVSNRKEFYLDEQIRDCILLLEKQWSSKDINLNLELEEVKYITNEEMLSHVWINLLSNAIKFSGDNSEITVRCTADKQLVTVSISDQGIGIDKDTITHIFDKFYQGDSSRSIQGNGLGLSLTKRIIELCEGEINVISEKGKGTTFTVTLPRTE